VSAKHLPREKRQPRGGRPRADPRRCLKGILWILWTGAPWSELPSRYGSPTTCWRRLRQWEESGVLLALWRAFLTSSTTGRSCAGTSASWTAAFAPAKKGAPKDGLVRAAAADLAAEAMSVGPQAPKEVDHRRVDLAGPLLLGPVTAAG
jgi:transposase